MLTMAYNTCAVIAANLKEVKPLAACNNISATVTTKGNRYYVVVTYYVEGKRKQKWESTGLSVSGNNKRKAESIRKELVREYERLGSVEKIQMPFHEFMKQWLEKTKGSISTSTYYEYRKIIHNGIVPYFEQHSISLYDLKPYHIQEFYDFKMQTDKVTASTIHHYHANIHKALDYAIKMERIAANPADKVALPKKVKHIANYYSAEELKKLLDKAKGTQIEPVVRLAAWFGLRRGEIIGLRWSSIDFANKVLSVTGTVKDKGASGSKKKNMYYEPSAKTASSLRSFPMSEEVSSYLLRLKELQAVQKATDGYNHTWDDFVCVRPNGDLIPPEYVTRAFPKLCEECGLRRLKLHELRHTNISLLLAGGASMKELQEWAGHSSYATTANTYSHIQAESKNRLMETIGTLLKDDC